MKRIAIALFAAAGLAVSAAHANHDNRVTVPGSVTIGNPAPTVVYAPAPAYAAHAARHYAPPARGYWKEIVVKTWVPERHSISRDRWGRPIRIIEPGYYTYCNERVWVDTSRGHHRHHPHHSAYGYGRR